MRVAAPLAAFTRMAAPLVRLLNLSTVSVLRFLGLRPGFQRRVTDEDIIGVLIEGEKAGLIHAAEREMIEDVLDLSERAARSIMTPRPDVVWIDIDGEPEATIKTIRECPYAQLLVCRSTLDDVLGVVRKQDLLDQALDNRPLDVTTLLTRSFDCSGAHFDLRTRDLFRKTPVNTAVVVDEYGAVQGVLTRTDRSPR